MGYRVGHDLMLELAWVPEMTGQETERGMDGQPRRELVTSCIHSMAEPHSPYSRGLPEEGVSYLSLEVCQQLPSSIC